MQTYCKPLGRPPKTTPSEEQRYRMAKASGERNENECSFGTGKRIYRAYNIRAKLPRHVTMLDGNVLLRQKHDEVP